MTAAMRQLIFQHMPRVAHPLQRTITVCLADSGFTSNVGKTWKDSGAFQTQLLKHGGTAQRSNRTRTTLIQDVSTRWNSKLTPFMISCLPKNKEAVKATRDKQKHKLTMLTAGDPL